MDFPNDVPTNVYKIDDVNEIYWAFYARRQVGDGELVDEEEEEKEAHNEYPEAEERDYGGPSQIPTYILRERGYHVLSEEGQSGLWVFCLSETLMEELPQLLNIDQLKFMQSGCLHSTDLPSASGFLTPASNTATAPSCPTSSIGEFNNQSSDANTKEGKWPADIGSEERRRSLVGVGQSYAMADMYPRILAAMNRTLSYSLSSAKEILLIGPCKFADVHSMGDHAYEYLETSPATSGTAIISVFIRWLPSGTLLFTLSEQAISRLSTLAHVLSGNEHSKAFPVGGPLLLAPSGIASQYYGIEDTPKSHPLYRTRAETKSFITSLLLERGVWMPRKVHWAWVVVERDRHKQDSQWETTMGAEPMALWPAHLCLSQDTQIMLGNSNIAAEPRSSPRSAIDPLEKALGWFLGKSLRMEALDARRKNLAEVQKRAEAVVIEDEDALSDFEPQFHGEITPRDVSGIYPTPPDGLPFMARASSASNELHSNERDDGASRGMGCDAMQQANEEHGGDERNDDLFEAMDIDLFATNGLTEDDFSFFDEPGVGSEDERANDSAAFCTESFMFEDSMIAPAMMSPLDEGTSPTLIDPPAGTLQDLPQVVRNIIKDSDESLIGNLKKESPATHIVRLDNEHENHDEPSRVNESAYHTSVLRHRSLLPDSTQPPKDSFDLMPFNNTSSEFDDKYASHGRFAFELQDCPKSSNPGVESSHGDHVPRFGVLGMDTSSLEDDVDICELIDKLQGGCIIDVIKLDDTDDAVSTGSLNVFISDDANGAREEGDEIEKQSPEELDQHLFHKRKRSTSGASDRPATPLSSPSQAEDGGEGLAKTEETIPPTRLYSPEMTDRGKNLLDPEPGANDPLISVIVGNDRSFVQVAQLVAHQAVSAFNTPRAKDCCSREPESGDVNRLCQRFEQTLARVMAKPGKVSKQCTLQEFVDVGECNTAMISRDQNQNPSQHRSAKAPYPGRALSTIGQAIFKFQGPFTCVQRTGTSIDIAASALRFWEELGLAPSFGHKDVMASCVFPAEAVHDHVVTFLKMVKGAYQSHNLGLHNVGDTEPSSYLYPAPIGDSGLEGPSPAFSSACENIGKSLGKLSLQGGNTVVYMVNPTSSGEYLPVLCTAFLKLFESYIASAKRQNVIEPNDLVLQVVPSDLIYAANALPMPSPSDYRRLAFEVYDRCGPKDEGQQQRAMPYMCAPSVRLTKSVPKTIDFKLTPDNSALSLQSDNCLHIAYAWDPGEDWVTTSWIDNLGVLSWNACYCLRAIGSDPWAAILAIFKEIWETTLSMLHPRHGPWHLFICKCSSMTRGELDAWQSVFGDSNNPLVKSSVRPSLLTVDIKPAFNFPSQSLEAFGQDALMNLIATPEDTPQANAPSPEVFGLGTTPGGAAQVSTPPPGTAFGDQDGEARLVDIADETWGVLIKTSFDDLCIPSNHCSPLACGYLVKRAGPRNEDGLVRLGVSIIHAQTPHRPLLKAVLGWYRSLGLLARVRGIVDPVKSVVPYHIAATIKAHDTVKSTMRYTDGDRDL